MTFEEAKAEQAKLYADVKRCSDALKPFPRMANGLTPDNVKSSPEYREACSAYAVAFHRLRSFNEGFSRQFAKEIRAYRRARASKVLDRQRN